MPGRPGASAGVRHQARRCRGRRRLYEGGSDAMARSDDPLIVFAGSSTRKRDAWERYRRNSPRAEACRARAARPARFRLYGDSVYPDATGTLAPELWCRAGWTEPNGRKVAPFTFLAGCSSAPPAPIRSGSRRYGRRRKASCRRPPSLTFRSTMTLSAEIPDRRSSTETVTWSASCSTAIHSLWRLLPLRAGAQSLDAVIAVAIEEGLAKVYGLHGLAEELKR